MKLAALYPESQGYRLDDPQMMAHIVVYDVLRTCEQHKVEPIGALNCAMDADRFTGERALRWDFTPDHP